MAELYAYLLRFLGPVLVAGFLVVTAMSSAKSDPVEPSDAIASDLLSTRRSAPAAGALASSPTAHAPRLGLITPQYSEIPPASSYNPYTAGLTACPQREPGDPPCGEMLAPSYGVFRSGIRY